jgi:serine/threonine-protein kinase RsbW
MGKPAAPPTDHTPAPAPVVRRWPCTRRSVGRARHQFTEVLDSWGLGHLAEPAVLVLSELLTNSVRHARAPRDRLIETRYERTADGVRIEVHDADEAPPVLQKLSTDADADSESGRGLALVDVLTAGRWGVAGREGVGKRTWAVVADGGAG